MGSRSVPAEYTSLMRPVLGCNRLAIPGLPATERQLSVEAHTGTTGTFNWLLVRAIRRLGFAAKCRQPFSLDDVTAPAIVGVRLGRIGHFVAYLGRKDDRYLIGDPLEGLLQLGADALAGRYRMDRFAIEITAHQR